LGFEKRGLSARIKKLHKRGLVEQIDKKWISVKHDIYKRKKNPKSEKWIDNIRFFRVEFVEGLTLSQSIILAYIKSRFAWKGNKGQAIEVTQEGFAKMLGISKPTFRNDFHYLVEMGYLIVTRRICKTNSKGETVQCAYTLKDGTKVTREWVKRYFVL